MKKRLLSILLVATMLLAMIPAITVATSAANTEAIDWVNDEVITIYTANELVEFKKQIAAGNSFAGRTVKLGADIDMSGKSLATHDNDIGFCGVFDGQYHTIRNLSFSVSTGNYQGILFGSVTTTKNLTAEEQQAIKDQNGIIVKNFALVDSKISANARTAPLFAWVFGDLTVENVYIKADVTGKGDCTGGFIGDAAVGTFTFKNCAYEGTVSNSTAGVESGAFVGRIRNDKAPTVKLENCLNVSEAKLVGSYYGNANNREEVINCLHYNEENKETIGSGFTANASEGFTTLNAGYPVPTPLALPFFSAKMIDWTADNIEIVTADQLVEFKRQISIKNFFAGKTVKLGADIDMSGKTLAKHENDVGFCGVFDGQYHTIRNISCSWTDTSYQGILFGSVTTSLLTVEQQQAVKAKNGIVIKNFALTDTKIVSNKRTAPLFAWVFGDLTVENVYIKADVTGSGDCTGGFIGDAAVGTITFKNCAFEGTVSNSTAGVESGAFVGRIRNDKAPTVKLENCLNVSEAKLVGSYFSSSTNQETATNCLIYNETNKEDIGSGFTANAPEGFTALNTFYPVPTTLLPFFADQVEGARTAKTESLSTEYYGYQNTDNKDAVRFVGVVNGEDTDYKKVGYEIVAIRDNGNVWSDTIEVQAVYSSVIENGASKTAAACGGDYIFVASVNGMVANKGTVVFAIKTFAIDTNDVKTYTDMAIIEFDTTLAA